MKAVFVSAIMVIGLANLGLGFFYQDLVLIIVFLWLFFCGFNLLEATLPSLISKTAPADLKGTAMGVYSSSQFMGAFIGGLAGGWLYGEYGATMVFWFCGSVSLTWFIVALFMKSPRYLANLLIALDDINPQQQDDFMAQLLAITGVKEVILHFEEKVAYLKVDNQVLNKEDLQYLLVQWQKE